MSLCYSHLLLLYYSMKTQPQLIGLIGHRIAHTLSPAIHTAAFKALNLPFSYGVFDVAPEFLAPLIGSMRKNGCVGANVTIPHKQAVIPLLDDLHDDAATLGAVNVIVNRNGKLIGYNTDMLGIKHVLEPSEEKLRNASVVILGAGGGARAAVYAISKFFSPRSVLVYNRSTDRAEKMISDFKTIFPKIAYERISGPERLATAFAESVLIMNTTSVGMKPNVDALPIRYYIQSCRNCPAPARQDARCSDNQRCGNVSSSGRTCIRTLDGKNLSSGSGARSYSAGISVELVPRGTIQ